MLIVKNTQFLSCKHETLSEWLAHELRILPKYQLIWSKIVDFLRWTCFWIWVKFFVTVSIWLHCVTGGLILTIRYFKSWNIAYMSLSTEVQPIGTYNLGWSPIFQLLPLSFCGSTRLQKIATSVQSVPGDPSIFRIMIWNQLSFGKMCRNSVFTKV